MDIKQKVNALVESKGLTLEKFHQWLRNLDYESSCCQSGKCVGNIQELEDLVFKVQGHCFSLNLFVKPKNSDDSEYVKIHSVGGH